MFEWSALIPLFPLLAAVWIGLTALLGSHKGEAGERPTARLACGAALIAFLLLLLLDILSLIQGHPPGQVVISPWMTSGKFQGMISLTLDHHSLAMATLIALLSWITLRFSVQYMHREEGFQRFFALLSLFLAAMLLIVLAGNMILMFTGWELAGLTSFLLIGYAMDRPTAVSNASRALITNRFGDAGFIVAITLSFVWLNSVEWPSVIARASHLNPLKMGLITGGILLAALAKSAQFPFAAWIHRSLEGPTPSSALFYGSLMIHAGVFLLIRLSPLIAEAPAIQLLLLVLGTLTTLYTLLVGLVQTDIKSALLLSTQSQVGLMFMACGLGWFELAFWHMMVHTTWRGYLFLMAPSYMHLVHLPQHPQPKRLGHSRTLYAIAIRRLWLDALGELLITRPTLALARDIQTFDDKLVDRLIGQTHKDNTSSAATEWHTLEQVMQQHRLSDAILARGILGRILEELASGLHWFEKGLVLSNNGGRWLQALKYLGHYLELADKLLGHPRYLVLILVLTFTVIL